MKKNTYPFFNRLIQIGFVVKDLKTVMDRFLKEYNVGPWYVIEFNSKNVKNMSYLGFRKNYAMLLGVCPIGGIRFEVIEPLTKSIYSEYLDKYGEGIIHHIKLEVNDYRSALDYIKSLSINVLQHGEQLGKCGKNTYTYLDSKESLGFISEIANITEDFIKPEPEYWYTTKELNDLKLFFVKPIQIGIITRDLEKKISQLTEFFNLKLIALKSYSNKNINDMYVHEKPKNYSMRIAFFDLGNVVLKIIEPSGSSIFTEFYDKYGEGVIHHLRMEVKSYTRAIDFLQLQSIKILQSGLYRNTINFAFFETNKDINFITEIVDNNAGGIISAFCP